MNPTTFALVLCALSFVCALLALWSPPRARGGLRIGGALLSLFAVLAFLPSCSALGLGAGNPADPVPQLVQASRSTHDVIGPRFVAYVTGDPNLSPTMRDQLTKLVDDWRLLIEKAEAYLAPVSTPAPTK